MATARLAFAAGFPSSMNDRNVARMKTLISAAALALLSAALAGCGGVSPYRLETRDPVAADASQKTYEQLLWEKRRAERAQGGEL